MKPTFPLIQVDIDLWDIDIMAELFLYDDIYHSKDEIFYNNYICNKKFLDTKGHIFIAKNKDLINDSWLWVFTKKTNRINFQPTMEKWSFDDVKTFFYNKINELPTNVGKEAWLEALKKAKTIKELFEVEW